jgi:hypothetical protein
MDLDILMILFIIDTVLFTEANKQSGLLEYEINSELVEGRWS